MAQVLPAKPLFACTKCTRRFRFEELSKDDHLCEECHNVRVNCKYCLSRFEMRVLKDQIETVCSSCATNRKSYGSPKACSHCQLNAAFGGNFCQRCAKSEKKHGPPSSCELCGLKCAFDRSHDKKLSGKRLCWKCTLSFKKDLLVNQKKPAETSTAQKLDLKRKTKPQSNGEPQQKRVQQDLFSPSIFLGGQESSALRDQISDLKRLIAQKEQALMEKDKQIAELKASMLDTEKMYRQKISTMQQQHKETVDELQNKIRDLQRQVATLSRNKRS